MGRGFRGKQDEDGDEDEVEDEGSIWDVHLLGRQYLLQLLSNLSRTEMDVQARRWHRKTIANSTEDEDQNLSLFRTYETWILYTKVGSWATAASQYYRPIRQGYKYVKTLQRNRQQNQARKYVMSFQKPLNDFEGEKDIEALQRACLSNIAKVGRHPPRRS